ncbi:MAG: hypothetical protein NC904_05145 [Candidatus Omnitrophica bacterium]|nr:hypothetical protein [Candidatus Omnitrophota bacterium]
MNRLLISIFFILLSTYTFAHSISLDKELEFLSQKAKEAIKKKDTEKSEFYLAQLIGKIIFHHQEERFESLFPLFKELNLDKPTSLISAKFNEEFLKWFIESPALYWKDNKNIQDQNKFLFKLTENNDGEYSILVLGCPFLEGWYLVEKDDLSIVVIPLISFSRKPQIIVSQLKGDTLKEIAKIDLDTEDHPLQYIWKPELYDLDKDGVPEIWLRYNKTWATGFSQELAIYKIEDEKVKLWKKFEGVAEGIARRLEGNKIEVGFGTTDKEGIGHLGFDQTHLEIYEYRNEDFVKISDKTIPHILWTEDWKKYYFYEELKEK